MSETYHHTQTTTIPPGIETPAVGMTVPAGEPCPRCGVLRQFWVYMPFSRQHLATAGWALRRSMICECPERRPHPPRPVPPPGLDQRWLDEQLPIPAAHTFLLFPATQHPQLRAANLRCACYARDFRPRKETFGLYLAGPPAPGREWLLDAVTNAARASGTPAARITAGEVFARCTEARAEFPWDPEARSRLRGALRTLPVLAIAALGATPGTPLEWKELADLVEHRSVRGLVTHFSAHAAPESLRRQNAERPLVAQVYLTAEAITKPAIVCPDGGNRR